MSRPVAGLVLAGGSATRLGGGDKPLLDLGGRRMLDRVIATLTAEAAEVAISANGDPGRFAGYGLPVLPDGRFAGQGPLAGILAGLDWAAGRGAEALLTIPGDTPFVPAGLAAALAPPPACAVSGGTLHHLGAHHLGAHHLVVHHLVALWPVSARDRLRQVLSVDGPRGVGRFAAALGMRGVTFPALPQDPFLNVNTPEDLALARARVEGRA